MKPLISWIVAAAGLLCATAVADQPESVLRSETATTLWDTLIDATARYVKTNGPDADVAQFISMAREAAWARRDELAALVTPYLRDSDSKKVAGAVAVLYRLRSYRPMGGIGDARETPEERFRKRHATFFARLDQNVHGAFDHFHQVNNDEVYRSLALYLGAAPSKEAKRELLRLAKETAAKEQALICLAWHRDPEDMTDLLPFMLEDNQAAWALPYHFRNSYGKAALPYLKQAVKEAKGKFTREHAEKELRILEQRK